MWSRSIAWFTAWRTRGSSNGGRVRRSRGRSSTCPESTTRSGWAACSETTSSGSGGRPSSRPVRRQVDRTLRRVLLERPEIASTNPSGCAARRPLAELRVPLQLDPLASASRDHVRPRRRHGSKPWSSSGCRGRNRESERQRELERQIRVRAREVERHRFLVDLDRRRTGRSGRLGSARRRTSAPSIAVEGRRAVVQGERPLEPAPEVLGAHGLAGRVGCRPGAGTGTSARRRRPRGSAGREVGHEGHSVRAARPSGSASARRS